MEKVRAKYWKKIMWVNPEINRYTFVKVGVIYGDNEKNEDDEHYVFDKKTKKFLIYYKTKTILKLKKYLTQEELTKKLSKSIQKVKR